MLRNCAATKCAIRIKTNVLLPLLQGRACLSTATTHRSKNTNARSQAKIMGKLFGERVSGSKKRWYPTHEVSSANVQQTAIFSAAQLGKTTKQQGKHTTRRMTVLNKLFMKHITDLLATGEASEKILGRGMQVSRVKISPDFAYVNVFWLGSGASGGDMELEEELHRCSGLLRHELSQLCLMGEVPRINFVRDKTLSNMADVDALLRNMDLGEDYKPTELADEVKRDFKWKPLVDRTAVAVAEVPTDTAEQSFPEMRHDVLGLDHRSIMLKIHTKMRKSKQAWELHEQGLSAAPTAEINDSSSALERVNQKLANAAAAAEKFDRFLAKRRERRNTPERKRFYAREEWVDTATELTDLELTLAQRQMKDDDDYLLEEDEPKSR